MPDTAGAAAMDPHGPIMPQAAARSLPDEAGCAEPPKPAARRVRKGGRLGRSREFADGGTGEGWYPEPTGKRPLSLAKQEPS